MAQPRKEASAYDGHARARRILNPALELRSWKKGYKSPAPHMRHVTHYIAIQLRSEAWRLPHVRR